MGGQDSHRSKTTPAVMCIKILLQGFNLFYLLLGACLLGIGIWTQMELSQYFRLTGLYYDNAAYVMIGVGVLILLVSLGGFYCTAKNKVALLYIYAIFIGFVAVLQIAAGIAGGVFYNQISDRLRNGLETEFTEANREQWNIFQEKLKCCGIDGPQDWTNKGMDIPDSCKEADNGSRKKRQAASSNDTPSTTGPTENPSSSTASTNTSVIDAVTGPTTTPPTSTTESTTPTGSSTAVPQNTTAAPQPTTTAPHSSTAAPQPTTAAPHSSTAAPQPTTASGINTSTANPITTTASTTGYYQNGCFSKITDNFENYLSIIIGVAFGFVIIQIVGVILACCLARKVNKNNYEQIY